MRVRREVVFSIGGYVVRARVLAALITIVSLALVALGGFVRGTNAGLSCPDWPLCYGQAVPDGLYRSGSELGGPELGGVMQEVAHRYLASIVSVGVLLFSFFAYRRRRELPRVWALCRIAILALLMQICLGGLTVLLKLNPFIVTAHLAMGTVIFQLFARLALEPAPGSRLGDDGMQSVTRPIQDTRSPLGKKYVLLRRLVGAMIALIVVQILLGGFVGSSGSALACPDLPLCYGQIFPTDLGPQPMVHMFHRLMAIVILTIATISYAIARYALPRRSKVMRLFLALEFMVAMQIALGVSNVFWRVPVGTAVLHLVVAQGILLVSIHTYRKLALRYAPRELSIYASQSDLDRRSGDDTMHYPVKRRFAANF